MSFYTTTWFDIVLIYNVMALLEYLNKYYFLVLKEKNLDSSPEEPVSWGLI